VTLARVGGLLPAMGITRIAHVTGLDAIGIPVVMVCRPNSRSLAVHQGKGLSLAAAQAAGVMEAIESYHGEHITLPLKIATYEELAYTHTVVDPSTLNHLATSFFHGHLQLAWIEGLDLRSGESIWVPYEMVHTNYSLPMPAGSGCFPMSSNGVASGNQLLEAISHAICEVVERDSTTLWHATGRDAQDRTRLDLGSVTNEGCCQLLALYERADIGVVVWETTSDVGIPAFLCSIFDRTNTVLKTRYVSSGMGCHPTREVALSRALTEAAQSRLTLIAGSRDDNPPRKYLGAQDPDLVTHALGELHARVPMRRFDDVPSFTGETFEDDVTWELTRLEAAGFPKVIAIDLTRPEFRIPVVRVIIPGLEGSHKTAGYVHGPRGRARMER
jgi:ribosomal protein S12 methylthiotransferase accessory factor